MLKPLLFSLISSNKPPVRPFPPSPSSSSPPPNHPSSSSSSIRPIRGLVHRPFYVPVPTYQIFFSLYTSPRTKFFCP